MIDINAIAYTSVVVFFKLIGRFPPRWALRASRFLGELWFAMDERHRQMALGNLTLAFGGEKSDREIRRMRPLVARINEIEASYQALSEEDLREKTAAWKARLYYL